jgi:glutamate synthase domain-containing protein 2
MPLLVLPFTARFIVLTLALLGAVAFGSVALLAPDPGWSVTMPAIVFVALVLLGLHDLVQTRHAVLRNYPITAHLRFLLEEMRPEMRQYFFEDEKHGMPFSRDKRAIVYQRAKHEADKRPFGTQYDVYSEGYEWIHHSTQPTDVSPETLRVTVGGPDCARPYSASVFNVSAMSFGALSANAIRALNAGAARGRFFHDTGEGGFSVHHRAMGGDVVWELGSGYFGARDAGGRFDPERFGDTAAVDQIRMIEVKLSQGAKPGHGGVLPAAKVTAEIAAARGVPIGEDCISPARHSAFSTPIGLLEFVATLRELAGGKPIGIKLCVGHPWEWLAIVKAMLQTGITPDFVVVDGKEGGTGAAPLELMDHLGMPLRDGLTFVHNALVGAGLRDRMRIGASGKIVSAFDIARAMALGADWCNAARGFMFAVGCIQSQSCHTDRCPVGVATQDASRARALVVEDKATRVFNYHHATVAALAELTGAAGLGHPGDFSLVHFTRRVTAPEAVSFLDLYPPLARGELIEGTDDPRFRDFWRMASAESFRPTA